MSRLGDNSALLIAGLDLSLVQMLTSAMRAVDASSPASPASGGAGGANNASQSTEQRPAVTQYGTTSSVYHDRQAATFEHCEKVASHPPVAQLQNYTCERPAPPADPVPSIQPPWKVLPWPVASRPVAPVGYRLIKVQPNRTDVINVIGQTLDLFV